LAACAGSKARRTTGKDNCAWHLFDRPRLDNVTEFVGRIHSIVAKAA